MQIITNDDREKIREKNRARLAEHFIPHLPLLVEKYICDANTLAELLIIPHFFELDSYLTSCRDEVLFSSADVWCDLNYISFLN